MRQYFVKRWEGNRLLRKSLGNRLLLSRSKDNPATDYEDQACHADSIALCNYLMAHDAICVRGFIPPTGPF